MTDKELDDYRHFGYIQVSCPCCGDGMADSLVVCWECYRITDRLQPGTYLDENGVTATDEGYAVVLTSSQIQEWDTARDQRTMPRET